MVVGTVTGAIWATRKAPCFQGQTLLVVDTLRGSVVAADHVGAGVGDKVLLITGSAAARFSMESPTDAVIVAIIDPQGK